MFSSGSAQAPNNLNMQYGKDNLSFYTGLIPSRPYGDYIDNIHKTWKGNYKLLEVHHGYIQWLFPICEQGMNSESQPLTESEATQMRNNETVRRRVVKSYEVMLDFYGIELKDQETGELKRNELNYLSRYAHLNRSFHNYLRITRILKFMGIMGYEHYKEAFIQFMILETFKHGQMPNIQDSLVRFWMPTLRRKEKLQEMDKLVETASGGRRKVDRARRDGYGDELQSPQWATKLYVVAHNNQSKL